MNKRIKKKKRKLCDFCSTKKQTQEIYGNLQICNECKVINDKQSAIADSIEG